MMRTLWPNLDCVDRLETVLEVPIPEEMFTSNTKNSLRSWHNMKEWMKTSSVHASTAPSPDLQILLGVVGAPLVPLPVSSDCSANRNIKDHPIESSMAKYIVEQYIAAAGGDGALNAVDSMLVIGKVKMAASDHFNSGDVYKTGFKTKKGNKVKDHRGGGDVGSFVLWQKRPDLWSLELVFSGCKIGAGSDGNLAWRQTPWHHPHASRGPARPLRRSLQGLDPRSTANLFSNSVCMGEKAINDEDCFVLKLETEATSLQARSSKNVEIIRHTIWGYFSQKTGLLVKLEDTHLLRIKTPGNDNLYWETTMESFIQDYRTIEGVNIAHSGKTFVSLFRFGETTDTHLRTRMEEAWTIEEVDFNIQGLSKDCFLPPGDLRKQEEEEVVVSPMMSDQKCLPVRTRVASGRFASSKVVAIDVAESDSSDGDEEK